MNENKVVVTPKMILGMLAEGKDRKQIGTELGLNGVDVKRMFQHPELKGRKVKKFTEPAFVWAEEETIEEVDVEVVETETEEAEVVPQMGHETWSA